MGKGLLVMWGRGTCRNAKIIGMSENLLVSRGVVETCISAKIIGMGKKFNGNWGGGGAALMVKLIDK